MLIIAIGHGSTSDEYTCSTDSSTINPKSVPEVLEAICKAQDLPESSVDELLVIQNDDVIAHYTWEDGLGAMG